MADDLPAAGTMKAAGRKPAYTPYDGSSKPFTIRLSPLAPEDWIEPDEDLRFYLDEKRRLCRTHLEQIFRAEQETLAAQEEVLSLLSEHLCLQHPSVYRCTDTVMEMAGHSIDLADENLPPLLRAGLLVQDDLVIMRRGENGWRIAAAFVAFPSSWSLDEKFGLAMEEVHASVPDFQAGTRNAALINRMFDNLQPSMPVKRFNWSINWTDALFLPASKSATTATPPSIDPDRSFVRVERQTLRKLPVSGDILFTIRIYLNPVRAIRSQPDAPGLAASLAGQLEALTKEQLEYKGLADKCAALVTLLRRLEKGERDIA